MKAERILPYVVLKPVFLLGTLITAASVGSCYSNRANPKKPEVSDAVQEQTLLTETISLLPVVIPSDIVVEEPSSVGNENEVNNTSASPDPPEITNPIQGAVHNEAKEEIKEEVKSEPEPEKKSSAKKKGPGILKMLEAAKRSVERPPLTSEESEARERVIKFLGKYGTFNHSSVEPFIQGLMSDNVAIKAEIEKIKQEENLLENPKPRTENEYMELAKKRISERAREKLMEGLTKLGVSLDTNRNEVLNTAKSITSEELLQFQNDMNTINGYSKKVLGTKMKVEFKSGFSVESANHLGNFGTPPGGILVEVSD